MGQVPLPAILTPLNRSGVEHFSFSIGRYIWPPYSGLCMQFEEKGKAESRRNLTDGNAISEIASPGSPFPLSSFNLLKSEDPYYSRGFSSAKPTLVCMRKI